MKRPCYALALASISSLALAQSSTPGTPKLSQFAPPPGDTAVEFLRQVFGGVIGLLASGGNIQGGSQDTIIGGMMGIYVGAVLFLGMLFVAFSTVKATVNSAHDGQVFGARMHAHWVPLRTVTGVAVLLPLGSGFCLVQVAMMWLALQSVGVADSLWQFAVKRMATDQMITRPMIPDSRPLAATILKSEVCAAAMNKHYAAVGRATRIETVEVEMQVADARYKTTGYKWRANDTTYVNPDVCGTLQWRQSWEGSGSAGNVAAMKGPLLAAHTGAVRKMILELRPVAVQIVSGQKPVPGAIDIAANNYENALRAAAKAATTGTAQRAYTDFLAAAKDGGVLFAGTWYNHIGKMNDVMQSTLNALPVSDAVSISGKETEEALLTYQDALAAADEYTRNRVNSVRKVYYADTDVPPAIGDEFWPYFRRLLSAPFMGAINRMTESIAGSNLNHMTQMKAFGDTLVLAGEALLSVMSITAGAAGGWIAKMTVGSVFNFQAAIQFLAGFVTLTVIGLTSFGVMLAHYVPMVPFVTWTTAVVNWFVLVCEAVLAAPLFAVAHTHPDGDEVAGKGAPGWPLVLSLFLRLPLMLFGLVLAMNLTEPITGYINTAYMTVVAGVQADSFTGIVGFLAYVAIYVALMTTIVHIVFSLIHWIPDNVLRWVGTIAGGIPVAERAGEHSQTTIASGIREVKHGVGGLQSSKSAPKTENSAERASEGLPSNDDLLGK